MNKKALIASIASLSVLTGIMAVGTGLAAKYESLITPFLCGTGDKISGAETENALSESDALCKKIEADSIVLLKNKDGALPISETKLNVFGYGATDKGFLLKGIGSGSSTISSKKKVSLIQGLINEGFEVNEEILNVYNDFTGGRPANPDGGNVYRLAEPSITEFEDKWERAKSFSDVALFVLSRDGGENVGELPKAQPGNPDKTYLDITNSEQEMLDKLKENFGTVIVLLNTTNTMHTGFLNDDKISAALNVGITGQSGAQAIGQVLNGTVNPSGKTTDIMPYTHEFDPTYINNEVKNGSIAYEEDIYYGYKWYETADKEGFFNNVITDYGNGYDGVIQYPFGYGLSYTNFEWEIVENSLLPGLALDQNSEVKIKVNVTNTGEVPGKDVVELYYTPNYITGEVEKAEINLLDFAKTAELKPGQSQVVELSFTTYDLASYDAYDKNGNGSATYELDKGDIHIKLMNDSHHLDECEGSDIKYLVEDDIIYNADPTTGGEIKNRFTGEEAYAGVPIDGSTAGIDVTYLTRSNFKTTFPDTPSKAPKSSVVSQGSMFMNDDPYLDLDLPFFSVDQGLRLFTKEDGSSATIDELNGIGGVKLVINEELCLDLSDYDSETWDTLLNQMTKEEISNLVEFGGFHTHAIQSIGKRLMYDYDGPAGFNTNTQTGNWNGESPDTNSWTAYPSESLMGCSWNENLMMELGLSMGLEGNLTKINGWYAPGVNLHRSAYTARNYEYYSEDGVLSGKLAAKVINGAKANGLYCYLKHFACSEPGPNPKGVNTWLTEQNLRENYLRPFEIAVKEGESNAIMTAFNRVGATWAGANYAMNIGVLRNEWGFKGSLITDWTQGDGIGQMNVRQGVRGGNDLMLNPNKNSIGAPLDRHNKIDMICARNSAKNILYTMIDTWEYNFNFDESILDGLTKVEINFGFKDEVFPWWIPTLAVIDFAIFAGLATVVTLFIVGKKKNLFAVKNDDNNDSTNNPNNGDNGSSGGVISDNNPQLDIKPKKEKDMKITKQKVEKPKKERKGKLKRSQVVALSVAIPVGILFTVISALALGPYADLINRFVAGANVNESEMNQNRAEGEELAEDMVKEGVVLLKNDYVLPLDFFTDDKVNVFGWSSTQWVTGGSGSGRVVSSTGVADIGTGFIEALNDYGIETNTELTEFYESYASARPKYADGTLHAWNWQYYRLIEPQIYTDYPQTILDHAEDFSQTAIVVISRVAGESSDAPKVQYKGDKNSQKADDPTRTYLEISKEEEDMLMYVGAHFENVVVVVNSINTMELGFVDIIPGIDACLLVGGTGYNACKAVPEILWGDVSPSGKLSDTYAYELESNPTYVNSGLEGERVYTNSNNSMYPNKNTGYGNVGDSNAKYPGVSYLDYEESVYLGYKWYETADDEGYFDDVSNDYGAGYYGVVQYPFGYGLTYNEGFDWEIVDLKIPANSNLNADDKIEMTVRVTNTGSFPAKDVVEVYYTPKYIPGEIEKASINLAAFAKTSELAPETYEDVKLSFDVYDMASYDCYDMNKNGFKGYELDKGEYQIHLMSDAHTLHDMNVTPETAYEDATITYNIKENIQYENDPDTGVKVSNRFTGSDSIDVAPIDGSSKDGSVKSPLNFLTRKDGFATSFPKEKPARKISEEQLTYNLYTSKQAEAWRDANEGKYTDDIITDAKNGLTIEGIFLEGEEKLETLGVQLGGNFDDPRWEQLLDQLSMSEMRNLTLHGYTKTSALPSIGKPEMRDVDGPAQIGSFNVANAGTGFPNATVLAQTWNTNISYSFGIAIGKEAKTLGYDGWYGPGINLHRSPFGGRNYEYFSEDAYLTGAMASESVRGAKNAGVYCYLKHLAVYDQEEYRDGLYTWLSEQALREIYLKPFKMCVADGGATGIMTSYNRLGGCWVGGSSALLEKVVREEWGFNGTILTDYADHQNYMSMDHALRSGGDLWMDGWLSNGSYKYETSSKSFHHALRLASKHIIYTLLNAYYTNAIYNESEDSEGIIVGQKVDYNESWKIIVGVGEGVIMAGLITWVTLVFVLKPRKRNDEPTINN